MGAPHGDLQHLIPALVVQKGSKSGELWSLRKIGWKSDSVI